MSSTIAPSFQAGGLASGLDTNTIIDGLVQLQQQPIDQLQSQQQALRSQISLMGDIASRLSALDDAARGLAQGGVLATRVASSDTGFTAVTGAGAASGTYAVRVDQLAVAAKARSTAFPHGTTVAGGQLTITLDGNPPGYTTAAWADGASLQDVADAIRASGAPVTALVLDDGTNTWLSVTRRDTGFQPGTDPAQALQLDFSATGATGQALSFTATQQPRNALLQVDGVDLVRTSNVVADVIPGTTLTLQATTSSPEDLIIADDAAGTQAALQRYVDAYDAAMALVQRELAPAQNTDRSTTLTGDSSIRSLQSALQALGSRQVAGLGAIRSLADLGVKTNRDGSLTLDTATLSRAIARDPAAVDGLFKHASTGIAAQVHATVDAFVGPGTGILVQAQSSMSDRVKSMDQQVTAMQDRLDQYRATLVARFAAMEDVVSQMKSIGTFLAAQSKSQQGQ